MKMDLALNNLQKVICHKTQTKPSASFPHSPFPSFSSSLIISSIGQDMLIFI